MWGLRNCEKEQEGSEYQGIEDPNESIGLNTK